MQGMSRPNPATYRITVGDVIEGKDINGRNRQGRVRLATNHHLVIEGGYTIPRERASLLSTPYGLL